MSYDAVCKDLNELGEHVDGVGCGPYSSRPLTTANRRNGCHPSATGRPLSVFWPLARQLSSSLRQRIATTFGIVMSANCNKLPEAVTAKTRWASFWSRWAYSSTPTGCPDSAPWNHDDDRGQFGHERRSAGSVGTDRCVITGRRRHPHAMSVLFSK